MKCGILSSGISSEELSILLLLLSVLGYKGFQDRADCHSFLLFLSFCSFSAIPHSWRVSHIIYFFSVDLGPPPVDHTDHYSSARPISHIPKLSVSYSNQGCTVVQGHFLINAVRTLVGCIQCGGDSFPLDCSCTIRLWISYYTYPFPRGALGGCLRRGAVLSFWDLGCREQDRPQQRF